MLRSCECVAVFLIGKKGKPETILTMRPVMQNKEKQAFLMSQATSASKSLVLLGPGSELEAWNEEWFGHLKMGGQRA